MPLPHSMRRFRDERGYLRVDWLVGAARFPVYGLDGHPLGMTFGVNVGCSSMGEQLTGVTIGFAHPPVGDVDRSIAVTSVARTDAWAGATADWVHLPLDTPLYDEDARRFARHRTVDEARRAGIAHAHLLIDRVLVAGTPFAARLQFWSRPDPEWRVTLQQSGRADGIIIAGTATGLSGNELVYLIERLVVINKRSDLLTRYQEEYERRHPFRASPSPS